MCLCKLGCLEISVQGMRVNCVCCVNIQYYRGCVGRGVCVCIWCLGVGDQCGFNAVFGCDMFKWLSLYVGLVCLCKCRRLEITL